MSEPDHYSDDFESESAEELERSAKIFKEIAIYDLNADTPLSSQDVLLTPPSKKKAVPEDYESPATRSMTRRRLAEAVHYERREKRVEKAKAAKEQTNAPSRKRKAREMSERGFDTRVRSEKDGDKKPRAGIRKGRTVKATVSTRNEEFWTVKTEHLLHDRKKRELEKARNVARQRIQKKK